MIGLHLFRNLTWYKVEDNIENEHPLKSFCLGYNIILVKLFPNYS